jgi:hypothetical protein
MQKGTSVCQYMDGAKRAEPQSTTTIPTIVAHVSRIMLVFHSSTKQNILMRRHNHVAVGCM